MSEKLSNRIHARIAELKKSRDECARRAHGLLAPPDYDVVNAQDYLAAHATQTSLLNELEELILEGER